MNGAEYIIQFLKDKGVKISFGYPGGKVLNLYDAMYRMEFPHILARHEQGAAHAAEGYARITGTPGVVIVTSGPGATNVVTGIANAHLDSTPLLVISGQVDSVYIGKDAFQEADVSGITIPITKNNYLVQDVESLPAILEEAWNLCTNGRHGPVLLDIPSDIFKAEIGEVKERSSFVNLYQKNTISKKTMDKVISLLSEAKQPVIISGGGMNKSQEACDFLAQFAKDHQIPVVNTLMGIGSISTQHECAMGMIGMHGMPAPNITFAKADLVLSLGCRFSDRVVAKYATFKDRKKIIQVDIDRAELAKSFEVDAGVHADLADFLGELIPAANNTVPVFTQWMEEAKDKKERLKLKYEPSDLLLPQDLISFLAQFYQGQDPTIATDVGQNQMFAAQYFPVNKRNGFITSGGLGTMGFGLPSAIGAAFATEETVLLFTGDGGFQMTLQELGVVAKYNLPIKMFVLDNSCLGMVRQWQELFFNENYSHSLLDNNPDFVKIAEAYQIEGCCVSSLEDLKGLKEQLESDKPVLFHCFVKDMENVFPIIPPGKETLDMEGPNKMRYME